MPSLLRWYALSYKYLFIMFNSLWVWLPRDDLCGGVEIKIILYDVEVAEPRFSNSNNLLQNFVIT